MRPWESKPWPEALKSPAQLAALHQDVVNANWPKYPRNFPDRERIAVWVRIVWEVDGEEWCAGWADRWNDTYVRVRFAYSEPRADQPLVWVLARNVRRRRLPARAPS